MTVPYTIRIAPTITEIDARQWDACANPDTSRLAHADAECQEERFNPFISHAFLAALESPARSAAIAAGCRRMCSLRFCGQLVAAAPTYLKAHSMGEYVFDHAWADAYARAGLDYYPKLQVTVPFTPATGRRLLVAPTGGDAARTALILGLRKWREQARASSIHVTFPTKAEWLALGEAGFLRPDGPTIPLRQQGLCEFRGFSLRSRLTQTQDDPSRTQGCAGRGNHDRNI